jgi:hypothetical protein
MIMGTSIGHGTQLHRTSKFWPKRVSVFVNRSIVNHGLMSVQNWLTEGLQWLQDPCEVSKDNLSNVRWETSRQFRKRKREYVNDKISEPKLNSKIKNIRYMSRGITEFKKGYQPRTNVVRDDKCDLLENPHIILNRWKNYFCQLSKVQGAAGLRQTEIHRSEPFVPEVSICELLESRKCIGLQGWIRFQQDGKHCILRCISLLSWSGTKKNYLTSGKSQLLYLFKKKGYNTDCSNYRGIPLVSTSYKILSNILLSRLIPYADEIIGDHKCGFRCNRSMTDQIFYGHQILEKKRECNGTFFSCI